MAVTIEGTTYQPPKTLLPNAQWSPEYVRVFGPPEKRRCFQFFPGDRFTATVTDGTREPGEFEFVAYWIQHVRGRGKVHIVEACSLGKYQGAAVPNSFRYFCVRAPKKAGRVQSAEATYRVYRLKPSSKRRKTATLERIQAQRKKGKTKEKSNA